MQRTLFSAIALAALGAPGVFAENQTWTQIDLSARPSETTRFEFGLTTELRYQPDGDLDTIELRPGVAYDVSKALSLSGGYLYASSRREGPDQREHRLWQQAAYDLFGLAGGAVSGRTRVEERWREGVGETGWRLRQQVSYERSVGATGLTAGVSSEAFLMLSESGWGQSRDLQEIRSLASIQGRFEAGSGWELGYLNQFQSGREGAPNATDHHIFLGVSADF